ncbi:hypothetical protein [Methylovirgula sp. 4M-Z18]|nr:hypothetical protein [Methylovirgula sp. 4M-Z18]
MEEDPKWPAGSIFGSPVGGKSEAKPLFFIICRAVTRFEITL